MENTELTTNKTLSEGDTAILDFLNNHDNNPIEAPPLTIARNSGLSESYVKTRIRELDRRNIVEHPEDGPRGYYQISDRGKTLLKNV